MTTALPTTLRILVYAAGQADAAWRERFAAMCAPAEIEYSDYDQALYALRDSIDVFNAADTLLVAGGAELPELALARLVRHIAADPHADVVSVLNNVDPELSPLPTGAPDCTAPAADVDRGVLLASSRQLLPTLAWSRNFVLWRRRAIEWLVLNPEFDGARLPDALTGMLCDALYVGQPGRALAAAPAESDPRRPAPASPLARLRSTFAPRAAGVPLPGFGAEPVVLHIVHGWGGGAAGFIRDLALADRGHCHLALVARGDSGRRCYGEVLELVLAADEQPIRRYELARPIAATTHGNAEYRAILQAILASYAIDAVMISSLIGHDLAALATHRPTVLVTHDYYPLWPILHEDFGDAARRFDALELSERLPGAGEDFPFADRDAAGWQALRQAYVEAVLEAKPTLVAPSASARSNLLRIEPRFAELASAVIPHGLRPFPGRLPRDGGDAFTGSRVHAGASKGGRNAFNRRLRVLVLGRINAGKGARLLDRLTRPVPAGIEFHFLGCGAAGMAFFGRDHVDIEFDYRRDELPAAIARIAPDVALLPATVAETFSYTLSELRALGVPVLATRLGSLAERIVDDVDGWLVAPDADTLKDELVLLSRERSRLGLIRERLTTAEIRDSAAMAADYATLLGLAGGGSVRYALSARSADAAALDAALTRETRVALALAAAEGRLDAQQVELEARADWAYGMQRERDQWRKKHGAMEADRDRIASAHVALAAEFEDRTRWALSLDRQREELERDKAAIVGSWSWKLTWPLRFARRRLTALRQRLRYQLSGATQLGARAQRSIGSRGLGATIRLALARLIGRGAPPVAKPDLPDVPAQFVPFELPTSATPRVTVVIPVYNHFEHTHTCLRSLAAQPSGVPFEVIVVDDGSTDRTDELLQQVAGLELVCNPENLGFIGACNAGLAKARGEFVVFLNNDTAVGRDWLLHLVRTFEERPDAGLVGAKLVYPDGRLQEAGGIVFSDGSGWNYGRFDDPAHPSYNFVREVDYCSGAAIMLRTELMRRFGGFDERYKPAYYEDTDLAFKVREAGLRCYLQPASQVVHFEGVSSGTDTSTGIKRFQVINQEKFVERWKAALVRQPRAGSDIRVAREHRVRGRILVIDALTPTPDQDSGSLRMVNLLKLLVAEGWKVWFAAENLLYHEGYSEALQQLGVEVLHAPHVRDPIEWLTANGSLIDAAVLSRHYIAERFLPLLREVAPRARIVFDTVDLHYLREQRAAELSGDRGARRLADKTKLHELDIVRRADLTLVVSPVERELLERECPGKRVEVLSNVHELGPTGLPAEQRRDLLFVGGFGHPPNIDAVTWFVTEVWPRIAQALPDAKVHVVGSQMSDALKALGGERVQMHGFVADLAPLLASARVSIAPLRYGAGVKGKINQAMAHGLPVVATPVAVEGMYLVPEEEVLVGDGATGFADAVVRLYRDPRLWQRLAEGGRANVMKHFSFEAARSVLRKVLPS